MPNTTTVSSDGEEEIIIVKTEPMGARKAPEQPKPEESQ